MTSHPPPSKTAPFIMPDGRTLAAVLRAEASSGASSKPASTKTKSGVRGKDALWAQLQHGKRTAMSEAELAEVRAIERVGHRRRRAWLNDMLLRNMAGPLSAADMMGEFNPAPFGSYPPPSAFELAASREHAGVLQHFLSIDPDKQATVLERWEAHNHEQRRQQQAAGGGPQVRSALAVQQAAAAAAVERWGRVSPAARAGLKKASVHSVLALEAQLLQLLEDGGDHVRQQQQGGSADGGAAVQPEGSSGPLELELDVPDSFGRLLVHGLAQFHGLRVTRVTSEAADGSKRLLISRKASPPATSAQQQQPAAPAAAAAAGSPAEPAAEAAASSPAPPPPSQAAAASGLTAALQQQQQDNPQRSSDATWLADHAEITCTDVLMALHELGGDFGPAALRRWMRNVHGSDAVLSSEPGSEYVFV